MPSVGSTVTSAASMHRGRPGVSLSLAPESRRQPGRCGPSALSVPYRLAIMVPWIALARAKCCWRIGSVSIAQLLSCRSCTRLPSCSK